MVNTLMAMPAAKGLFHQAINQSGEFRSEILTPQTTQAIGPQVLQELGLSAAEVDRIQRVPFDTLAAAGARALAVVNEQLKATGTTVPGFGLGWGPSLDGSALPYQFFDPAALALSKDIPLLIGTVKNEFMPSLRTGLSDAGAEEVQEYLTKQYGEKAEGYAAAVRAAYPDDTRPSDLIDVDMMFRPGAVYQGNAKAAVGGGAPVYMYLFTWQSPVMDGKYKALHCMEIPFVFDNSERCQLMTGGGEEANALARVVSQSWINFARAGDPNQEGMPAYEPYTKENGSTIVLDVESHLSHHPDRALLEFMESASR